MTHPDITEGAFMDLSYSREVLPTYDLISVQSIAVNGEARGEHLCIVIDPPKTEQSSQDLENYTVTRKIILGFMKITLNKNKST